MIPICTNPYALLAGTLKKAHQQKQQPKPKQPVFEEAEWKYVEEKTSEQTPNP